MKSGSPIWGSNSSSIGVSPVFTALQLDPLDPLWIPYGSPENQNFIDFLNILNFLAAISPWHQTSPNSQIKVEIWICKDRYLHQDNSDRQPGHDAICGDIGSVCNANYRCQIIIFITLDRGHYTTLTPLLRSVSPLLIIVITVNMRPLLIYSGYTCYTDLHLHPSRLTFTIQNIQISRQDVGRKNVI